MIKLQKFVFNPFGENTYILWEDQSKECMVLDPGCFNNSEENELDNFVSKNQLQVKYLINTHCHIDHILGNAYVKSKYNPEFLAPEEDIFLLNMMMEQAGYFGVKTKPSPLPDRYLKEELKLSLADNEIKLLFTPGHSPGGYCLYFPQSKICITGDVLFRESIGRTDLWGGDYDTLINSIQHKIISLPEDVIIYPGHDESSTIGYEKLHNPFLT